MRGCVWPRPARPDAILSFSPFPPNALRCARQERDRKRLEAMAEKERKAEEKRVAADAKKREKELARAQAAQEKSALRQRTREAAPGSGPPDDLELEDATLLEVRVHGWGGRTAQPAWLQPCMHSCAAAAGV